MKIGFVTCSTEKLNYYFPTVAEPDFIPVEPPFTPDDQLAVNQLRMDGFNVMPIIWGTSISSLQDFQLIIVRSPWDYMDNDSNISQFLNWIDSLESAGIQVCNSSAFMRWLLDKHYLRDLQNQGVSVIPTRYYEQGSSINLLEIYQREGELVLKPCISAAGIGLFHIQHLDDAQTYQPIINEKLKNCSYMEQKFIPEICTNGEWSLIFFGGKYSHAIHKKPGNNSILVHAERGGSLTFPAHPPTNIIQFASDTFEKVLSTFKMTSGLDEDARSILYLRIDVIDTNSGPIVIECEGVEPELFFRARTGSERQFCDIVKQKLS